MIGILCAANQGLKRGSPVRILEEDQHLQQAEAALVGECLKFLKAMLAPELAGQLMLWWIHWLIDYC